MTFPFKDLYEYFAKPFDGRKLKVPCSDPVLMKLKTKNGRPVEGAVAPPHLILPYLVIPNGQALLQKLIDDSIEKEDDSFCMILAHEGHIKLLPQLDMNASESLLDKGLSNDPNAQHVLMVRIFHRTSVYSGFLPIDANRCVKYAPATGLETEVLHVKVNADQNFH